MKKKIFCPHCGKWLFTSEDTTEGVVYVWCRHCRQEIRIVLKSH